MTRSVGGGMHRTVELQHGERVLYEAVAGLRNARWVASEPGMLYLTNQRLIWARHHLLFPLRIPLPRRPILVIPLGHVLGTEVKRPMFGNRWRLLVRTRERTYSFVLLPVSLEEDIEECRDMLEKQRGSHGTRAHPS